MPSKPFNSLSLGAGVQSSTLLLMSCRGELPRLDAAIFADTGWEPKNVYANLYDFLIPEATKAGIPVYVVNRWGNIRENHLKAKFRETKQSGEHRYQIDMPVFSLRADGSKGITTRKCTSEYKIKIINRKLRSLLGYQPRQRIPAGSVVQWLGISTDELRRARISKDRWIDFWYPLIEDKRMNRQECRAWLSEHYPDRHVPRSACVGCPFHSNAEWRDLRDNDPEAWADAVEFDKQLRDLDAGKDKGLSGKLYLHADCVPLDEVDLSTDEERGQGNWLNECAGICGV